MVNVKQPFPAFLLIKQDVLIDEINFLKDDQLILKEFKENEAVYSRVSDKKSVSVSLDKIIEILGFTYQKIINCCYVTYGETIVGSIENNVKIKVLKIGESFAINPNSFEVSITSEKVECIKVTDDGKLIVATKSSVYLLETVSRQ